jgi:hypothetical protein
MNNIYSSAFDIDSVDDLDTEIIAENIIEDIKDSISAKWNSESIGKLLDQMMIRTFSTMDAHFRVIEGGKSYISLVSDYRYKNEDGAIDCLIGKVTLDAILYDILHDWGMDYAGPEDDPEGAARAIKDLMIVRDRVDYFIEKLQA